MEPRWQSTPGPASEGANAPEHGRIITKGDIFNIFQKFKGQSSEFYVKKYKELVKTKSKVELGNDEAEGEAVCTGDVDLALLTKLKNTNKSVVSKRGIKREQFMLEEFIPPKSKAEYVSDRLQESPRKRELRSALEATRKDNRKLKRSLEKSFEETASTTASLEQLSDDYEDALKELLKVEQHYASTVTDLINDKEASELTLNQKLVALQSDYEDCKSALDKLKSNRKPDIRNIKKLVKRRDLTIERQSQKLTERVEQLEQKDAALKKAKDDLDSSLNSLKVAEAEINMLKREKKLLQQRVSYYSHRKKEQRDSLLIMKDKIESEKAEIDLQMNDVRLREKELEALDAFLNDNEIKTFADGKYMDFVRQTIMELLAMNVSVNKVNDVITCVLKRMAGTNIERLPSKAVRCQMLIEARHLADIHVGQAMLDGLDMEDVLGNTIHGDGTTKYHRHYQTFQVTTQTGQSLSAGLLELGSQDAESLLQAWKERVAAIAKALASGTDQNNINNTVDKLISSVKNTVSDQCATNGVFNRLLQSLREEVLPRVVGGWDGFDKEKQEKLSEMGNFFCMLHPLLTFAEEANKALIHFENACLEGTNYSKFALPVAGESGSVRTTRTSCSAFEKRGHQAAGMSQYFDVYLKDVGEQSQFIQMVGNRFNVLFFNAAATFYHKDHMQNFIQSHAPTVNRLLQAVSEDLGNKVHLAGLRALGIVGKLITGPYFRVLHHESVKNVLDLNPHLHHLQVSLEQLSKDSSSLLEGKSIFSEEISPVEKNAVFHKLIVCDDEDFNALTQQALELICSALLLVLERQCEDQLPGGKYFSPSESLLRQASNAPTTNIISERDFAVFDVLLRQKPAASTAALEALIMWMHNKTSDWIDTLTDEERRKYHKDARRNVMDIKEKLKERRGKILQERRQKMIDKQGKEILSMEKKVQKKAELTLKIETFGGLWVSIEAMEVALTKIAEKERVNAMYCQLQFHKSVLNSKGPAGHFF